MRRQAIDAAARPLLGAALAVLAAGSIAAGVAPSGATPSAVAVAGRVLARDTDAATVGPSPTTPPVFVEVLGATSTTVDGAAPPTAAPATTVPATTVPAAAVVTSGTTPTTLDPPTTTAPPPPPAPAEDAGVDVPCEQDLVDRTNAARADHGLPSLAWDGRVHPITRRWSRRMLDAGRISHNPNFGAEMTEAGIDWHLAGENVGRGDTASVFDLWMRSDTHRRNILSPEFGAFAVGCLSIDGEIWATQNFWG